MAKYEYNPQQGGRSNNLSQRMLIFAALFFGFMMVNQYLFPPQEPPKKPDQPGAEAQAEDTDAAANGDSDTQATDTALTGEGTSTEPTSTDLTTEPTETVQREPVDPDWVTLGSIDPESPYRMLVTLSNRGASVMRVELNSDRYRDTEDRTGYMGQVVTDESTQGDGCRIEVVGNGTPAQKAGLQPGDLITEFNGETIEGFTALRVALLETRPGDEVDVTFVRNEQTQSTKVKLTRRPMEIIRPESLIESYQDFVKLQGLHGYQPDEEDPLSMLMTLNFLDGQELQPVESILDEDEKTPKWTSVVQRDHSVDRELPKLHLRSDNWEIQSSSENEVVFSYSLPQYGLEILKRYSLACDQADADCEVHVEHFEPGYHINFEIEIRNTATEPRKVGYVLDGPNGLPIEGAWYARKVGPGWSQYGLRDCLVSYDDRTPSLVPSFQIGQGKVDTFRDGSLSYMGVDAQYFSAVMMPQMQEGDQPWFAEAVPIRVGGYNPKWRTVTNTSFRLTSQSFELAPGDSLKHTYTMFAGPKKPQILEEYGLGQSIFYGWFWFVAIPMQWILHMLTAVVFNYGLAIILLTVIVRLGMHPISRKQMKNAQMMQLMQPEIKKIADKHKNDPQARAKAQQELFRKHNFNPLGGCGVMFLQLPIFIGLYRALQVDVELREAALLTKMIRWCSNLAAPDMMVNWSGFWENVGWDWFNTGQGMFSLGPYFNLLPILTIILFLAQQKIMMPKPTTEQEMASRKMMNFMMLFMGLIFFKVASGLCIYFIASSIWGLVERKLLPKPQISSLSPIATEVKQTKSPIRDTSSKAKDKKRKKR